MGFISSEYRLISIFESISTFESNKIRLTITAIYKASKIKIIPIVPIASLYINNVSVTNNYTTQIKI